MSGRKNSRVLMIGLGQIGYANAEYMAGQGNAVDGYDLDDRAIQRALEAGIIAGEAEDFGDYDYYVVCISTHNPGDMSRPYMDGLFDVARRIGREGRAGALVAVESTVAPGATGEVNRILGHRLHVAHFPHRYFFKETAEHGVRQLRVLGGCLPCCTYEARRFYEVILGIPVHIVSSVVYAELSKIIENSYRFLDIAYAEELKMFCDAYGLSFQELRDALNTKWNVEVLEARSGIGGHCLPKDSQMYLEMAMRVLDESLLGSAKEVDRSYRLSLAHREENLQPKPELAEEPIPTSGAVEIKRKSSILKAVE